MLISLILPIILRKCVKIEEIDLTEILVFYPLKTLSLQLYEEY